MQRIITIYKKLVKNFDKKKDFGAISVALITRLQRSETPFLNEFLAYYRCLGVDRFYLINTEPNNNDLIAAEISSEYSDIIELIDKRPEDRLSECPNCALSKIGEVFLLHVDMDEFLYLNGMTLQEFIIHEGLHHDNSDFLECFFYWIMSPLCQELYSPSIHAIIERGYFFPSKDGKCLARTQGIVSINNHRFEFGGPHKAIRYDPRTSNYFVFHVSARGIFDIINKIHYGQYGDLKQPCDPAKELFDLIYDKSSKFLPNRFVLLSFQSKFESHIVNFDFELPEIGHRTNTELLKYITLNGLKDLLGVEVVEKDIQEVVIDKINSYEIPPDLVDFYAMGRINLLTVLKRL